ncbi:hypothetical protein THRCLA_09108 [Thraustotheca clavata]|uniref:Protein kinase domain-containing protein n=1 Tax=Thraustotheca clavata TaxID=74557 RepID=A0A1V9YZL7_9STRA|nr:hypothetical protein THRCLA_09108 [Thraustotheca clavata]
MTQTGTPLWGAPEVLRGEHCSYAVDVYSVSVIITDLDTLQLIYFDIHLSAWAIIERVKQGTLKPTISSSCEPWLKTMASMCLAYNTWKRPTAEDIVDMLRIQYQNPEKATWLHANTEELNNSSATESASQSEKRCFYKC